MEVYDIPSEGYFIKEKLVLLDFFGFTDNNARVESVMKDSKEEFIKKYPAYTESDYVTYKHLIETFKKRKILSYIKFHDLLQNEYGHYLNAIKEKDSIILSNKISTIKNILVFFTWLWSIGAVITIIMLLG